jgi:hypothetical protein
MKIWCVACFRQEGAATIRRELYSVYVFSSLQKANQFLKKAYIDYEYDDYDIYESELDNPV